MGFVKPCSEKVLEWRRQKQSLGAFFKRWLMVMAALLYLTVVTCLVFVVPLLIIQYTNHEWIGGVWFFVALSGVVAALID
jgi:lipopolysaccharide/colanic/teichoic acid biosynthesis glycosyltransferase